MKGITPEYKIINKTSGKDITRDLKRFMISLSLEESADNKNDTLTISINGQGINRFPPSGTVIEIQIGYKETRLISFGNYKVDTKTLSGMPTVLTIKAGQTDFNAPIKTQKSRHFDNQKLGDILSTLAAENQLEIAGLSPEISEQIVPYLRQDQESDMNLIRRLAHEYSADGTVKSGKLVFKNKSEPARTQIITPKDLISFRLTWVDKPKYDRVIATWHDRDTSLAHQAIFDGSAFVTDTSGKIARVSQSSNSQAEARKHARSHWHTLHRLQLKASLNMAGNPALTSKAGLSLKGFIPEVDNTELFVKTVRHEIKDGYKTTLEATNAIQKT